jgi:hypothetical protein
VLVGNWHECWDKEVLGSYIMRGSYMMLNWQDSSLQNHVNSQCNLVVLIVKEWQWLCGLGQYQGMRYL